jgi:hypothetical protein
MINKFALDAVPPFSNYHYEYLLIVMYIIYFNSVTMFLLLFLNL